MAPTAQPLMGISEIAEYRGVTRQAAHNWRMRGKLPAPAEVLAMGPVWWTEAILAHFR